MREVRAKAVLEAVVSQRVGSEQVWPAKPGSAVGLAQSKSQPLRDGLLRKASSVTQLRELDGPAKALKDLSTYLSDRQQSVVRMMDEAMRTGSSEKVLKVTAAMIDKSAESDLLAKTVGKTVSAVDQMIKLN